MLKQIAGTTFTKIIITGLGFLTVILATRFLGAEEYGNISFFVLTLAILQLVTGVAGGPALVYLVPRMSLYQLFFGTFFWSVVVHLSGYFILKLGNTFTPTLLVHLISLSFIHYLNTFAYTVLLGQKRIMQFNYILLVQAFFLFSALGGQLLLTENRDIWIYIYSLYIAYGLSASMGWLLISKYFSKRNQGNFFSDLGKMIRYGGFLQLANGLQLFNYRLSYFFIDHFLGRSFLGIYNAGVQLSEGIWIFGKSFAVVQYSNISNSNDRQYAVNISLKLLKVVVAITFTCLLVLFILPRSFYAFLFGAEFGYVKTVIIYLSPGVLALSASQILSHFFSGTGQQHHNAIGSGIGVFFTFICGITLIPMLGLAGAGLTASCAFSATSIYQLIVFIRLGKCKLSDFAFQKKDIQEAYEIFKKAQKKRPEKAH